MDPWKYIYSHLRLAIGPPLQGCLGANVSVLPKISHSLHRPTSPIFSPPLKRCLQTPVLYGPLAVLLYVQNSYVMCVLQSCNCFFSLLDTPSRAGLGFWNIDWPSSSTHLRPYPHSADDITQSQFMYAAPRKVVVCLACLSVMSMMWYAFLVTNSMLCFGIPTNPVPAPTRLIPMQTPLPLNTAGWAMKPILSYALLVSYHALGL